MNKKNTLYRFSSTLLEMNTSPYEVSREDFLFTSSKCVRLTDCQKRCERKTRDSHFMLFINIKYRYDDKNLFFGIEGFFKVNNFDELIYLI